MTAPVQSQPTPPIWFSAPSLRRINRMGSVAAFIAEWDASARDREGNRRRYKLRTSEFGNINNAGRPGGLDAPELAHWHPQFSQAIEPGVVPLVQRLIRDGRWISYTSCAGHHYPLGEQPNSERHVGLLPRTDEDRKAMTQLLERVIEAARARWTEVVVQPALVANVLEDRERRYDVIDVYLFRQPQADWASYFASLPNATNQLADVVGEILSAA